MADAVHERLRDAILSAEFRPNHRLIEEDLALELQVSRTPIREALLRLRQEGLVAHRKGWVVREHSPAEILEVIEARAGVESAAAYLAADRLGAAALEALDALVLAMEGPELSRVRVNELNDRFHEMIVAGSGNALLIQFSRRTRINYWNFNRPVVFTPADDVVVNGQHREMLEALRERDSDGAARIAREHVALTARIIASALGMEHHLRIAD